jgi:CheY-like chemotaxis protein
MVLAVLDDLLFTVKINESAKRAGVAVEFLKSSQDVLEKARAHPALIILDLNYQGVDALKLIQDLKADTDAQGVPLIGYLSHVQGELNQKAQQAGCDTVLPRSAFSQKLTQILQSHAGAP